VSVDFNEPFGGILPGARGAVLATLLRTAAPLTGRRIHSLLSDGYSLWTVQETLKQLGRLGLVTTQPVGRAHVHTINEHHVAVPALRELVDPVAALRSTVEDVIGPDVGVVILFGSIARGDGTPDSDLDLAVIAPPGWEHRIELADHVRTRLGNMCDIVVFTAEQFDRLAREGEPVVTDILRDGIALVGARPALRSMAD
jgi:predicted nucleotidyltransferase